MSTTTKRMVSGDLLPPLIYKARYADPTLDLAEAITTSTPCVFIMRPLAGGDPVIDRVAATVVSATAGTVVLRYDWVAGDTDTPGDYVAEWELTISAKALTIPTEPEIRVRIRDDLG